MTTFLLLKYPILDQPSMREKFGLLYEGLDLRSGKIVLLSNFLFLYRRYLLGIVVVFQSHLIIQVYILMTGTVASLIIVGFYDAFLVKRATYNEYFNESIIMLSLYTFMCFTDFVPDPVMQLYIGYASCLLVLTHLGFNLIVMLGQTLSSLVQKIKRWRFQRNSKIKKGTNLVDEEKVTTEQTKYKRRRQIIQSSTSKAPGDLIVAEINKIIEQEQIPASNPDDLSPKLRKKPPQTSQNQNLDDFQLQDAKDQLEEINYEDCKINSHLIADQNDIGASFQQYRAKQTHEKLKQVKQVDTRPERQKQQTIQKLKEGHSLDQSYLENIDEIFAKSQSYDATTYQQKQAKSFNNLQEIRNQNLKRRQIKPDSMTGLIKELFPAYNGTYR